jgi:NADPH:quinone reductase
MRAIQVRVPGGPECLEEVSRPDALPAAGQVRVRAKAIGVGRADVLIRQGTYKWMPPLPAVPGAELAGEIDAIGEGAEGMQGWKIGDRVLISSRELEQRGGCYVEALNVPAQAPYRLPETIAFDDSVSLPNLQLALALMKMASSPVQAAPRSVLITGASGGVATMLAQLAKHLGLLTIGTSRTGDKQAFALEHGFDHVLDSAPATLAERVNTLTQGRGVDIVFDHLGGAHLIAGLYCLASFGTLVSYNVVLGAPYDDAFQVLRKLLGKSLALRCFSMHTFDQDERLRRDLMQEAIALMAQGHVRAPTPQRFALSDVRRAHEKLDQGMVSGKIVMYP